MGGFDEMLNTDTPSPDALRSPAILITNCFVQDNLFAELPFAEENLLGTNLA